MRKSTTTSQSFLPGDCVRVAALFSEHLGKRGKIINTCYGSNQECFDVLLDGGEVVQFVVTHGELPPLLLVF